MPESSLIIRPILLAAGGLAAGLLAHWLIFRALSTLERRLPDLMSLDDLLIRHAWAPMRLILPVVGLYLVLPAVLVDLPESTTGIVLHVLYVLLVVGLGWLFVKLASVMEDAIARRYDFDIADNLQARKMRTQVGILRRILVFIVIILGISAVLLRFEGFRQLGTGLLASAGIVGIIMGFAAQRTLGNLLAGFQIAVTQPIRVDDVVVVEGEWGRIEEITLTYVVIRIWDERRLILPISYFIEKPFQNWTRTSADILATVFLYVDYRVHFDAVRDELHRLLKESPHWDGRVWRLHVTDVTERTVQLRALMSAADSSAAWELRCEMREKLIEFVQRGMSDALPVLRAYVGTGQEASPATGRSPS